MKTRLFIIICILFPLFVSAQINPNDFYWVGSRSYLNGFEVSFQLDQKYTFYYQMENYIKITSNNKNTKIKEVVFEEGEVKKISDSIYCIIPNKLGRYELRINEASQRYRVVQLPEDKITIKFSASTSPFKNCITLEELIKSNEVLAIYNYNKIKIKYWTLYYQSKNSLYTIGASGSDSLDEEIKKSFKNELELFTEIHIRDIRVHYYDTIIYIPSQNIKVIDSYENEYIRRVFKPSSIENSIDILKNDIRIKIIGSSQKEIYENAIQDIANKLNPLLGTIKIKVVNSQPSFTIIFDTIRKYYSPPANSSKSEIVEFYKKQAEENIKQDSIFRMIGYNPILGAYIKEVKNIFFPFNTKYILYFKNTSFSSDSTEDTLLLKQRVSFMIENYIRGVLYYFKNSKETSVFEDVTNKNKLDGFDDYLLKTLYSKGGEEKIKAILSEGKQEKQKSPVYILLLVLTISLMFVFSEIYNYYNISSFVSKVRIKFIKRIIEAILVAQIPIIAYLILEFFNNGTKALSHEFLFLESMLIPFSVLSGLFLLFLDKLLEKIKVRWINTILNLILSFFCIALTYQLMYFFITPEFIKLSVIGWEILLVPFLITLYRLYASFQTNKIAGLLQEKELELTKQKELKFKSDLNALQARINPHFLYNALNSLASLTHIDSGRTEKMALSLSKLFRYNINKSEEHYACLKDEIEMASIYLEIEKNRFEDKLNYSIEIEQTLNDFIIPKFILQPLAENAVKHGISKITGKGMIRINIFGEANKVIIEIYDNGPEFPGGLISGYGLQNTYEKLKLLYKKPFDISFINTPEKKLVITLTK